MRTVYEAAGGADGLLRLAAAWHARVLADEVVSHAFSHGYHPEHTERLAAYWAEALGGPRTYSEAYGDETSVVRMHSGNGAHEEMDRRAIACFDQALVDAGLAGDERLRGVLHDYFSWATTTTMARYHRSAADVPDGLSMPHWSWDGLVTEPTGDLAVPLDLFAGIYVRDYGAARPWYERLLGSEPTFLASDTEAVWQLAERRWLYIKEGREHAGHAEHAIMVADLDARVAEVAERGIEPVTWEEHGDARKAVYRDPDGNEVSFGVIPG